MPQSINLIGRTALVTGGGRNIGRAVSMALADAGAAVLVGWNTDDRSAKETCDQISALGGKARDTQLHLDDPAGLRTELEEIRRREGIPDIVICNAAIRPGGRLEELTDAAWDLVFTVNVKSCYVIAQWAMPSMRAAGWGRIVLMGGLSAYRGRVGRAHVMAGKMAVVGLCRALAMEAGNSGVTCNVVVPGEIDTRRGPEGLYGTVAAEDHRAAGIPLGRLGQPDDVARACVFLSSDWASYVTGQEIFVTGGANPLAPREH